MVTKHSLSVQQALRALVFCAGSFLWGSTAHAAEIPTDGLIFHAPFDDSLDAAVEAEKLSPTKQGEFAFVDGRTNKAVRTGEKGSLMLFNGSKINQNEGTVSFWVRPQWAPASENFHMFWTLHSNGQFSLYKHASGSTLIFFVQGHDTANEQASTLQFNIGEWKPGEWHHVAASWSPGRTQLFVDGELKKEATDPGLVFPLILPNTVSIIGDSYHPGFGVQSGMTGKADTDIDDFRIYNHTLSTDEVRALAGKEAATMKEPGLARVVVPKAKQAPKVDGEFSLDEWKDAAGFSGFFDIATGRLSDKQSTVLVTYDDTKLYMAMFAPFLPGSQLQTNASTRDGATYGDDSIEIYLDPAQERKPGRGVQFVGNSGGYFLDLKDTDSAWNANWQYKSIIHDNWRGVGLKYWVTEIAIPFAELGRKTPVDGEEWAANFARSWVGGQQEHTSWAWILKKQYFAPDRFGILEFRGNAPAFQWTVLRDLMAGQPVVEGSWRGAGTAQMKLSTVSAGQALGEQELKADVGKAQNWTKTLDLTTARNDNLRLEARDKDRVLYAAELPYRIDTQPLRVFVSPAITQKRLIVDVDPLQFRRQWAPGWKIDVQVRGNNAKPGDKSVQAKTITQYAPPFARAEFGLQQIPVGDYKIVTTVHDESNKQVAEQTTAFTKKPDPKWMNSRVGVTDRVLKPWTPVVVSAKDLSVWGRKYTFENHALPRQIDALESPLLQGPMRVMLDGKELPALATAKYTEQTPARATRIGSSQTGAWKVDWKCTGEFDGVLVYEMTLTPQSAAGQTLQNLSLEIPMNNEAATLYATGDTGMGGDAGAVPQHWQSVWKQSFWLGNEKAGLSWFTETDQNWNLQDAKQALSFDREANRVLARVNFVTKPLAVKQPITYRFGLTATPMRPLQPGWRAWSFSSRTTGTTINVDPEKPTHALSWWMNWSPLISSPYDVLPKSEDIPAAFHKAGARGIPYNAMMVLNEKAPEFSYYRPEWLIQPQRAAGGEAGTDQQTWFVSINSSYKDYFLYALRDNVRNQGWDGHYFDFDGGAVPDTNELHDSGYVNQNGERRPTYNILAQRDFHKRLWAMLQDETKNDEPVVMVHNSASVTPHAHAFANLWLDGEQFNFSPKVDDDYTKVLSRETFRAEFLGSNHGSVVVLLPELGHIHAAWQQTKPGPEKDAISKRFVAATDTMLLYPLMHGTIFLPAWLDMEYLRPLYEGRRAFDIGSARFYGYWENQKLVQLSTPNPDVLATIYAQDDRCWLAIGNWTAEAQNVTAKLDLAKISPRLNAAGTALKQVWKAGEAKRDGNSVQLTIGPKSVRIVELN